MDSSTHGRSIPLDLLRALAVVLVLGNHMHPLDATAPAWMRAVSETWIRGGWVGVDLFFVLSGFLVSGLLFREYQKRGQIKPWHFLIRRGFKIYPGFWAMMLATVVIVGMRGTLQPAKLVNELLFVQNYLPGLWNHTWSLAVEEHFYIGVTALLALLASRRRALADPFRAIPLLFLMTAGVCLWLRLRIPGDPPYPFYPRLALTHLRIDALFFGVFLAYLFHFRRAMLDQIPRPARWLMGVVGVILLCLPFMIDREQSRFILTYGLTLQYVGSGMVLLAAVYAKIRNNLVMRNLALVGACSYAIYLWHMPVAHNIAPVLARLGLAPESLGGIAGYFVVSIVVGIVMTKAIEFPTLALRDRYFPSRGGQAVAAHATTPPAEPAVAMSAPTDA